MAEGVGGLRYVTGYPDRPPARPNLSLGDSLAGLHAALGIMIALYGRDGVGARAGQVVDIAIYESVFNMMEAIVPEYDMCGVIREREGTKLDRLVEIEDESGLLGVTGQARIGGDRKIRGCYGAWRLGAGQRFFGRARDDRFGAQKCCSAQQAASQQNTVICAVSQRFGASGDPSVPH